jgi:hypothetical protein
MASNVCRLHGEVARLYIYCSTVLLLGVPAAAIIHQAPKYALSHRQYYQWLLLKVCEMPPVMLFVALAAVLTKDAAMVPPKFQAWQATA